jgi:hypothetical protein
VQFRQRVPGVAAQCFRLDIVRHQKPDPVQRFRRRRFFLKPRRVADRIELRQRLTHQGLLYARIMHINNTLQRLHVGKPDVMEETTPQERVGQFLFVVRGYDHDRPLPRLDGLTGLVDVELHTVEFLQQVIGELDVGLVDLVNQEHRLPVCGERLPQLAATNVICDVVDPLVTKLAVAQTAHRIVLVKPLLGFGRRLHRPFDQFKAEALGDLAGQFGLAGARFAFHQKRPLEPDCCIDRNREILVRHIGRCAFKLHMPSTRPPIRRCCHACCTQGGPVRPQRT